MNEQNIKSLIHAREHLYNLDQNLNCIDRLMLLYAAKEILREENKYHYAEHNIGFTIDNFYDKWK